MFALSVLYAFASLLQAVASRSLSPRATADDRVPIPKFQSDFGRGNASAQWAPGYPKTWGSEDFHLQFNVPEPEDTFSGAVTDDEKYLAMWNGTHATFIDLDTKTNVSTFSLGIPQGFYAGGLTLRAAPQGGYDVLTSGTTDRGNYATTIFRRRIGSDMKPISEPTSYKAGDFGDIDKNGRMATTDGYIYDLNSPNATYVTLKNSSGSITGMSFSGDGKYLSTVGWVDKIADLYNATTGEKILAFPPTDAQNWVTKISPDNKNVVISLGTGYLQIYSLANLTAPPKVLRFNGWIRALEWNHNGEYLAAGDRGRMQIWKFPEAKVVQTWAVNDTYTELYGLSWLDGGNKVSWMFRDGRYMYDFGTNLKYWWTPGLQDHSWGGEGVSFLKKRGFVATADGDSTMRFWKI